MNPKNVSNKALVYFAIIAILIGLGVAYAISQSNGKSGETIIRSIKTGKEKQEQSINNSNSTIPPKSSENTNDEFCIQVITPARNPQTGDTEDFPSPCDVPDGWILIK